MSASTINEKIIARIHERTTADVNLEIKTLIDPLREIIEEAGFPEVRTEEDAAPIHPFVILGGLAQVIFDAILPIREGQAVDRFIADIDYLVAEKNQSSNFAKMRADLAG